MKAGCLTGWSTTARSVACSAMSCMRWMSGWPSTCRPRARRRRCGRRRCSATARCSSSASAPSRQMLHALDLNQIVVGDAVRAGPRSGDFPLFFQKSFGCDQHDFNARAIKAFQHPARWVKSARHRPSCRCGLFQCRRRPDVCCSATTSSSSHERKRIPLAISNSHRHFDPRMRRVTFDANVLPAEVINLFPRLRGK